MQSDPIQAVDDPLARGRLLSTGALLVALLVLLGSSGTGSRALQEGALCAVTGLAAALTWLRVRCSAPVERPPWTLLAIALTGYASGYLVLFTVCSGEALGPFGLNLSDCLSLLLFPFGAGGLVLLMAQRVPTLDSRALLDGLVVALATCAVAIALAATQVPTLLEGDLLAVLYRTLYPVGTLVLFVLALCGLVVSRRADPTWLLLLGGLAAMSAAEAVYGLRSAAGTFSFGTPLDTAFALGPCGIAAAAWSGGQVRRAVSGSSHAVMGLTAVATLSSLAVLVDRGSAVPRPAVLLGAAGIVAAVLRTVLFVRQDRVLEVRTRQALHDPLTELPNRRLLLAEVAARVSAGDEPVLLMVDLDRFTSLNSSLGPFAGDALLQEVAVRLSAAAPTGSTVARLGGDDFAVLLPPAWPDPWQAAHSLREAVAQALSLSGRTLVVAASIGVGGGWGLQQVALEGGADPYAAVSELLRRTDVALRRAKTTPRGIERWTSLLDDGARERELLLTELRAALEVDDQLVVHLQPKCDARTGRVLAAEALVRWQHPTRGLLGPATFLAEAEQEGLLTALTGRVLDASLSAAADLAATGHRLPVAVNTGAADLLDPAFAARVAQALDRHAVPPELLRLEVTETVVMSDPGQVVRTLRLLGRVSQEMAVTCGILWLCHEIRF